MIAKPSGALPVKVVPIEVSVPVHRNNLNAVAARIAHGVSEFAGRRENDAYRGLARRKRRARKGCQQATGTDPQASNRRRSRLNIVEKLVAG